MSTLSDAINKSFKYWFLKPDGTLSITKVAVQVAVASGAIVAFPATMAAAGITIAIPAAIISGAKITGLIAAYIAGMRAKNDLDNKAK